MVTETILAKVMQAAARFHHQISVVVPIGKFEDVWRSLLGQFSESSYAFELIFIGPQFREKLEFAGKSTVRFVKGCGNRVNQLNTGGNLAQGEFVWFLHADSVISENLCRSLRKGLGQHPENLHFFSLGFLDDGPLPTKMNALFANFRSHFLRLPFGDQGFCIKRQLWLELGGFSNRRGYGEDHSLVWAARRKKIKLVGHLQVLKTSARKYRDNGWGSTTALHFKLTWLQAYEESVLFLKERFLCKER